MGKNGKNGHFYGLPRPRGVIIIAAAYVEGNEGKPFPWQLCRFFDIYLAYLCFCVKECCPGLTGLTKDD